MNRTTVNPWSWSANLGFDQGHVVEGQRRLLLASGQDSVDADGRPVHPGDMDAQLALAMDNLAAVLVGADMTLANVVRLNVYSTDVDELFKHWGSIAERFGEANTPAVDLLIMKGLRLGGGSGWHGRGIDAVAAISTRPPDQRVGVPVR